VIVPSRLPRPAGRTGVRKEIVLRAAAPADGAACRDLDGSFATSHIWQLDTRQDGDELRMAFRLVRLPRELTLVAEHHPPAPPRGIVPQGVLWVVAEEVEAPPAGAGARGRIVGYVAAAVAPGDETAYLRSLVVERAYRRAGIATRLLAAAQRWAADQGATALMADVPARNYPALRLLQKAGFTFCGYNDRCYPNHEVAVFFVGRLR
jgi:ribosomal protein S18 acetylase RimI-like enzyme